MLTRTARALAAGAAFILTPSLHAQQPQPSPAQTLMAADLAWADSVRGGGGAAFAGGLAEDAIYLYPQAPLMRGRAVIAAFLAGRATPRMTWQPLRVVVSSDGSAGATWGVTASTGGGAPTLGRYITWWRREGTAWRAVAVMHTDGSDAPVDAAVGATFRPDTAGSAGARGAAEQADRAFAADAGARGAGEAFRAAAAPDAMMFGGPGMLRLGPDEIRAGFAGPASWAWGPVASGAAASGDLAFTVGEAEIRAGQSVFHSKYLTIWRRQPDGSWKFITDGGNGRPAR